MKEIALTRKTFIQAAGAFLALQARGASGPARYVIEFTRHSPAHNFYLLVREGGPGRIRFKSVRIERV